MNNLNKVLSRAEWQQKIFVSHPKRTDLLTLTHDWGIQKKLIRVHRNHSFEHIASAMKPYLAYANLEAEFFYSDYDDSLSFASVAISDRIDAEIIWLDYDRYLNNFDTEGLLNWICDRVKYLRQLSNAPILISNWFGANNDACQIFNTKISELLSFIPGIKICDQNSLGQELGVRYFDERAAKFTGTKLSDVSCIFTARKFACHWLYSALHQRLKAIVVDLDGTLYEGIIGEDGIEGIELKPQHVALQKKLIELQQEGVFLAIASKNEAQDVEQLFATRLDFPLKLEHFSAWEIGWVDKAVGIEKIASKLRIGIDTILFIDDNPGELVAVAQQLPEIKTLRAEDFPSTAEVLSWYPGCWAWASSETDSLRIADLKFSEERENLMRKATDPYDYIKSLGVTITFSINPQQQMIRLCELSQKTNQFNLNFERLNEASMAQYIDSEHYCVVSFQLKDRLSDSGIIGIMVGYQNQDTLIIEELCISCRALGRNLENLMIAKAIQLILMELPSQKVVVKYQTASRNNPALTWLQNHSQEPLISPESQVLLKDEFVHINLSDYPVEIQVERSTNATPRN